MLTESKAFCSPMTMLLPWHWPRCGAGRYPLSRGSVRCSAWLPNLTRNAASHVDAHRLHMGGIKMSGVHVGNSN